MSRAYPKAGAHLPSFGSRHGDPRCGLSPLFGDSRSPFLENSGSFSAPRSRAGFTQPRPGCSHQLGPVGRWPLGTPALRTPALEQATALDLPWRSSTVLWPAMGRDRSILCSGSIACPGAAPLSRKRGQRHGAALAFTAGADSGSPGFEGRLVGPPCPPAVASLLRQGG